MRMGSDCMVLLGKTGSGGRTGGFDLKWCLDTRAVWLHRLFAGAAVGAYSWEGL